MRYQSGVHVFTMRTRLGEMTRVFIQCLFVCFPFDRGVFIQMRVRMNQESVVAAHNGHSCMCA